MQKYGKNGNICTFWKHFFTWSQTNHTNVFWAKKRLNARIEWTRSWKRFELKNVCDLGISSCHTLKTIITTHINVVVEVEQSNLYYRVTHLVLISNLALFSQSCQFCRPWMGLGLVQSLHPEYSNDVINPFCIFYPSVPGVESILEEN